MKTTMNAERLQALIAAYGADPQRWPQAERAAAQALASDPHASAVLREARALDAALDALPPVAPDVALRRSILDALPARAPGLGQVLGEFLAGIGWRLAGPAFALALAGGVAAGVLFESEPATDTDDTELLALAQLGEPSWSDEGEWP